MAMTQPFSYREIAAALRKKDLLLQGPSTIVRITSPAGVTEHEADLPWALGPYKWMLPFLLCLEKHGKEDCMCWRRERLRGEPLTKTSAYIGWRKTESMLLRSHPLFAAPWEREKTLALEAWKKGHPGEEEPMADATIPWAKRLIGRIKKGMSPSAAATAMGMSRYSVTSARKRHPWFNRALIGLGYPGRPYRAYFPPGKRSK